jgi:hypothetical protein
MVLVCATILFAEFRLTAFWVELMLLAVAFTLGPATLGKKLCNYAWAVKPGVFTVGSHSGFLGVMATS